MKKKELRRILRGVLNLLENDLHEIADSVVEIDHRVSDEHRLIDGLARTVLSTDRELCDRIATIEREDTPASIAALQKRLETIEWRLEDNSAHHSRKV